MKKKNKKKILFMGFVILIFFFIWLLVDTFFRIAGNKVYPNKDQRLTNKYCVHFETNAGSEENLQIYSYPCNLRPNWQRITSPLDEDLHGDPKCYGGEKEGWMIAECSIPNILHQEKVSDEISTTECPMVSMRIVNNVKTIVIKQDWLCKAFAHDNKDPKEQWFIIANETGKFKEILRRD